MCIAYGDDVFLFLQEPESHGNHIDHIGTVLPKWRQVEIEEVHFRTTKWTTLDTSSSVLSLQFHNR